MKHINNLTVRILAATLIGFLIAGITTKNTCDCPNFVKEPNSGCISFEKVVMHPGDLITNKQNSLVRFSTTFAIGSLASFALLSLVGLVLKKKT